MLQQYLPFTVLKHTKFTFGILFFCLVATVLTVYGIETKRELTTGNFYHEVATVLTVYGIETFDDFN